MSFLKAECLGGVQDEADHRSLFNMDEKKPVPSPTTEEEEEEIATRILRTLLTAEKPGHDLDRRLQDLVRPCGWYEGLAKRVLDGLVAAVQSGAAMGGAMKEAFDTATAAASAFVHEHPVFTAAVAVVVAIGILVLLAPWAVEALGFAELGPVEGEFLSRLECCGLAGWLTWSRFVCRLVAIHLSRCGGGELLLLPAEAGYEVGKEVRSGRWGGSGRTEGAGGVVDMQIHNVLAVKA